MLDNVACIQAGALLLTVPLNQDALSASQKWMWHLVPTGSLLEEKEERTIWVHEPLVPRVGGESWLASSQEGHPTGLPSHGSKREEWEKLGFPIWAVHLGGTHRMRGNLEGTLGFEDIVCHPMEKAGGWLDV